MDLEDVVVGFPSVPVARTGRLEARRGERIGIVGPNGAGKTTLLRTIAGELAPLDGFLRLGSGVQIGYLAQVRRRRLPARRSSTRSAARAASTAGPRAVYLARFLFSGDDVFKPVEKLSGGERSRLELAIVGVASGQPASPRRADEPP